MSAGRNLITLFFTVNTLLQFFFSRPSPPSPSRSGKYTARSPPRGLAARAHATAPSKKRFFSAVFLNRSKSASHRRRQHCGDTLHVAASSAACPPAENFLSGNSTSGVAQAEMRKLIALFDRHARALAHRQQHVARHRSVVGARCTRRFFSPNTRRILTNDSRQKSDAPACRWWCVDTSGMDATARVASSHHQPPCGRPVVSACRRPCNRPSDHARVRTSQPRQRQRTQKKWPLCERPSVCSKDDGLSGRRLPAARRSRPATAGR